MFVEMTSKALLMLSSHCLVNLLSSSHTGERYFTHPMFSQIKKEAEEMKRSNPFLNPSTIHVLNLVSQHLAANTGK